MPNPDYAEFKFSPVVDVGTVSTDLYTDKRVNQFVTDYANYKETEVKGTSSDPSLYKYYHFVASPQAITTTNLGALASSLCLTDDSKTCLLTPYSSTTSGAPLLNTPDGHKMNLMKEYETYLKSTASLCKKFEPTIDTMDISDDALKNVQPGNVMAFDELVDQFSTMKREAEKKTKSYGIEIFAYIEFPAMGDYKFSFELDSEATLSTFFAWFGDVAPCEYMVQNSTMNINKRKDVLISVTDVRKVPLRLQYYCVPSVKQSSTSTARLTQQEVLQRLVMTSSTGTVVPIDLYSSTSPFVFIYPPLYVAFTSQTQNSYMAGQFHCYTNFDLLKANDGRFYNVIQKNKRDIVLRGVHNRDQDGIKEVGKLPALQVTETTPTYYTQNNPSNPMELPNVFSIYRFSIDSRYDHTYQISTKTTPHPMAQLSDSLLTLSDSYTDFPGYLPLNPTRISTLSANQCREKCTESPSKCGYYYTYTTNNGKTTKCVLDTTGRPPIFNQVRTGESAAEIDVGSGTLSVRNKTFKDAKNMKCAEAEEVDPAIAVTDDYTRNFKYANYTLTPGQIKDIQDVGTCGSKKYKDFVDRAKDILYSTHEYRSDGQWKPDSASPWITKEGLESKNSTAVNDTTDSIQSSLVNHDRLRQKLVGIHQRDDDLQHSLQAYRGLSSYMNSEDRYDQNGNMLLYLRSEPPPPSLAQLNANDSQLLSNQQTLLFYTGIITAATLIVLAVTMGSE